MLVKCARVRGQVRGLRGHVRDAREVYTAWAHTHFHHHFPRNDRGAYLLLTSLPLFPTLHHSVLLASLLLSWPAHRALSHPEWAVGH